MPIKFKPLFIAFCILLVTFTVAFAATTLLIVNF